MEQEALDAARAVRGVESGGDRRRGGDEDDEDGAGPLAEYLRMLGVRDGEAGGSEPELEEDGDPRDGVRDSAGEKRENRSRADGKTPQPTEPTKQTPPGQAVRASGNKKKRRKNAAGRGVAGRVVAATPGRQLETTRPGVSLSELSDDLAAQLHARGFAHAQFITRDAVCVVRDEIKRVAPLYTDGEIWLGKHDAGAQIAVKSVRGDRVFWMDPATADGGRFDAMRSMLRAIDELVLDHLARACPKRLGGLADRTHAMLAEYPGRGSRFVRHVDNTGRDGRRLTVLCYLNPDYTGEHGGALKVYDADDADGTRGVEVAPAAGTIAMFYADEVPHEVLPSARSRHSFTVWYYDETEFKDAETRRGEAAAADSRAAHMPSVDGSESDPGATLAALDASDREAQAFVRRMMTQRLTPAAAAAAARVWRTGAADGGDGVRGAGSGVVRRGADADVAERSGRVADGDHEHGNGQRPRRRARGVNLYRSRGLKVNLTMKRTLSNIHFDPCHLFALKGEFRKEYPPRARVLNVLSEENAGRKAHCPAGALPGILARTP